MSRATQHSKHHRKPPPGAEPKRQAITSHTRPRQLNEIPEAPPPHQGVGTTANAPCHPPAASRPDSPQGQGGKHGKQPSTRRSAKSHVVDFANHAPRPQLGWGADVFLLARLAHNPPSRTYTNTRPPSTPTRATPSAVPVTRSALAHASTRSADLAPLWLSQATSWEIRPHASPGPSRPRRPKHLSPTALTNTRPSATNRRTNDGTPVCKRRPHAGPCALRPRAPHAPQGTAGAAPRLDRQRPRTAPPLPLCTTHKTPSMYQARARGGRRDMGDPRAEPRTPSDTAP